ncbi:MAG: redoxin family protein [Lachnospiraceae bacterium]|nr:redoxin family protein [Lachnospiraceae bacterium]
MKKKICQMLLGIFTALVLTGCGVMQVMDGDGMVNENPVSVEEPATAGEASKEETNAAQADAAGTETDAAGEKDAVGTETDAAGTETETPADEAGAETEAPAEEVEWAPDLTFSTHDVINDTDVDETIFQGHVITMVNFWEPWCGPCVGEMPDLEKLYEEMGSGSGDGNIIGVYGTEEDAAYVLEQVGTTYPVLRYVDEMNVLISDYVPNTVFFDGSGHIIYSDLADMDGFIFIGSRSHDDWKEILDTLYEQVK